MGVFVVTNTMGMMSEMAKTPPHGGDPKHRRCHFSLGAEHILKIDVQVIASAVESWKRQKQSVM